MQHKHVHYDQKEHMSVAYGTCTVLFVLKILPFKHGLLLWSPSHKSCYGHSADNVHENVSGYGVDLTVFVLFENDGATIVFLSVNPTFYQT